MVIRDAHTSNGHKHLNLRRTIEKLSEKYAMGSRQYGITEENVRCVIQMCQDGSCAEKKKIDITIFKNFVGNANDVKKYKRKRKRSCTSNEKLNTTVESNISKKSTNKMGASSSKSETVLSLPKSENSATRSYVQIMPMSSDLLKRDSAQTLHPYPIVDGARWVPTSQNLMSQMLGSNMISAFNNVPFPMYPIQVVQAGSQPILPGQKIVFLDSNFLPFTHQQMQTKVFSPNGKSGESSAIDLSTTPSKTQSSTSKIMKFTSVAKEMIGSSATLTVKADNNNDISACKAAAGLSANNLDLLNITSETDLPTLQELLYSCANESENSLIDKTVDDKGDPAEKCKSHREDNSDEGSVSQKRSGVLSVPLLPHRDIWYCYDDIIAETNPYLRTCRCILDMSLDVNKSMIGCWLSINRLRKKITYVQELISYLQDVTKEHSELTTWN
ncbi:hypothetical protein ACF0H5_006133 [Mactra antiquata]